MRRQRGQTQTRGKSVVQRRIKMMTTTWNKMCSFRSQSSSSTAGKSSASSFRRRGGRRGNERGGGREQRTKTRAASSQHPPEEKDNNRILERRLFACFLLVCSAEKFLRSFSSFPAKRLNFFFPRLYCYYTIYARKNLFSATTRSKNNNNMRRPRKNLFFFRAIATK